MKIYMVENRKFRNIQGLWTNPDKLIKWVLTHMDSQNSGETDLDVFMGRNRLIVFKGEGDKGKWIEWSELFPME